MSTPFIAWHIPVVGSILGPALQDGGGVLSELDFASVLILIGIIVLLFAIIGPSIRRIAVVEFIEPSKEELAQKPKGIFGLREQIALAVMGAFLLGIGFFIKADSKIEPACPVVDSKNSSIRIRTIGKACGCSALDFFQIQIESPTFPICGEWFNREPNTQLWAFLLDSNETVLRAKRVSITDPDQPFWNTTFTLRSDEDVIGDTFVVSVLVLDKDIAKSLQADQEAKRPINMPTPLLDLEQDVVIERVETIDDISSICPQEEVLP